MSDDKEAEWQGDRGGKIPGASGLGEKGSRLTNAPPLNYKHHAEEHENLRFLGVEHALCAWEGVVIQRRQAKQREKQQRKDIGHIVRVEYVRQCHGIVSRSERPAAKVPQEDRQKSAGLHARSTA